MVLIHRLAVFGVLIFSSCLTATPHSETKSLLDEANPSDKDQLVLIKAPEHPDWKINDEFLSCFPDEWKKIASVLPVYKKVFLLNRIFEDSSNPLERFWAAATLFLLYRREAVNEQALEWLGQARSLEDSAALKLESAWMHCYSRENQNDIQEQTRPENIPAEDLSEKDRQKWRFLQLTLRYSQLDLTKLGLDENVSAILLDYDDLWIATWKGALGRLSLMTKEFKILIKAPTASVSSIKHICASGYFIYVFRDEVIQRYSKVTETWKEFPLPPNWSGLRVQDVVMTGETSFWLAHLGRGLWEWKEEKWIDRSAQVPSLFLNALFQNEDGSWFIGSQDRGLWKLDLAGNARAWPKESRLNITFITKIKDHVIVGTYGRGLWGVADSQLQQLAAEPFVVSSLKKENHLWWGTLDLGLRRGWGTSQETWGISEGFPLRHITKILAWKNVLVLASPDQGIGMWLDED